MEWVVTWRGTSASVSRGQSSKGKSKEFATFFNTLPFPVVETLDWYLS